MTDGTRVCAYMYKAVEHLSIHNVDDEESSEDYGAADIQVSILQQWRSARGTVEVEWQWEVR